MYLLPLPELEVPNRKGIIQTIKSIPDKDWWWQPARNPKQKPKTLWYKLHPGHPIFDSLENQFAIPTEPDRFEIHLYRLRPMAELFNHKDRSRNTIIFINLENFYSTRLFFYKDDTPKSDVILEAKYTETPLLIDGLEHHGVRNESLEDRLAVSISFNQPYDFDMLEELYKHRQLLKCQGEWEYRFVGGRRVWNDGPEYPDYFIGQNREDIENAYEE